MWRKVVTACIRVDYFVNYWTAELLLNLHRLCSTEWEAETTNHGDAGGFGSKRHMVYFNMLSIRCRLTKKSNTSHKIRTGRLIINLYLIVRIYLLVVWSPLVFQQQVGQFPQISLLMTHCYRPILRTALACTQRSRLRYWSKNSGNSRLLLPYYRPIR